MEGDVDTTVERGFKPREEPSHSQKIWIALHRCTKTGVQ